MVAILSHFRTFLIYLYFLFFSLILFPLPLRADKATAASSADLSGDVLPVPVFGKIQKEGRAKHVLPYPPRFLGELAISDQQMGEGELMVPLYGNSEQMIYGDVDGKFSQNQNDSMISVGGGYRGILGEFLLGAYLFGDSNRTIFRRRFNVLNPGIELMTNRWDFHLNGYIPTSKRSVFEGECLGEAAGIYDFVSFKKHTQFDMMFNQFETVGRGLDTEVGFTLPTSNRIRLFAGGYYFNFEGAESMRGIEGGVEVPVNRILSIGVRGRKDNIQGGMGFLTLRVTLGGKNKAGEPEIEDRMLDPIPRHLASMGQGTGIPSQRIFVPKTGKKEVVNDDVWFFTAHGGSKFVRDRGKNNCTFENPCRGVDYNQNNVNEISEIDPGTHFYFDPGNYRLVNNLHSTTGSPGDHELTLNRGQSMYGRTRGYLRPANDDNRPVFEGSLRLTGRNLLTNLDMSGVGTHEYVGIVGEGASHLVLNKIKVSDYKGVDGVNPNEAGGDAAGIFFKNGADIQLNHVAVRNIQGGSGSSGHEGLAGSDNPGGVAGNGGDGTMGAKGGKAVGIELVNVRKTTLAHTVVSQITGGEGGKGGAGGSGGDASHTGDNRNAVGGDGGKGALGGSGGEASGFRFDRSRVNLVNMRVQNISGGLGGNGGAGGAGGSADSSHTVGTGDAIAGGGQGGTGGGGQGGLAGQGGSGGAVYGMVSNHSQVHVEGRRAQVIDIHGGRGGRGGKGGSGGGANASNNAGNGIAGGGAIDHVDSSSGKGGGDAGIAADGGSGGQAVGISLLGGSFTLAAQKADLLNVQGGLGGLGGLGGSGGDANANHNARDGYAGGSANGAGSRGGVGAGSGSSGGAGGSGGEVQGIWLSGSRFEFSGGVMNIQNIKGGEGGDGGAGGLGGSANANHNQGEAALGGGAGFGEGVGGKGAGNGGIGGLAGAGGHTLGISAGNGSTVNFSSKVRLSRIEGGAGGDGGLGGNGGHANANENTGSSGSNSVAGGGTTGGLGTQGGMGAGDGGAAGRAGKGGNVIAVKNQGSIRVSGGLDLFNIQGGKGGRGGVGGLAGDANAIGNAGRGIGGGGSIGGVGGLGGGQGGTAGIGGEGGDARYLTGNAISGIIQRQTLLGGHGGAGGVGGQGGDGKAENNSVNQQGKGGDGGNGGNGGKGGDAGSDAGQPGQLGGSGAPGSNENGGQGGSSGNGGAGGVALPAPIFNITSLKTDIPKAFQVLARKARVEERSLYRNK